jgi:hypothetical protein
VRLGALGFRVRVLPDPPDAASGISLCPAVTSIRATPRSRITLQNHNAILDFDVISCCNPYVIDTLLTVADAARRLDLGPARVRQLADANILPLAVRTLTTGARLFRAEDVDALVRARAEERARRAGRRGRAVA